MNAAFSDGLDTRVGTITSDFTRYMAWKSENGERPEESGVNYFTTLINGVFPKERILDIIRNFIVFQDIKGKTIKIMAGYHQNLQSGERLNLLRNLWKKTAGKLARYGIRRGAAKACLWCFTQDVLSAIPNFIIQPSLSLQTAMIWTTSFLGHSVSV